MIDYVGLLQNSCPDIVIEHVLAADPSSNSATLWPGPEGLARDYSDSCRFAVLGYYAAGIGPKSTWDWDTSYVWDLLDLALAGDILKRGATIPPDVKADAIAALGRLALPGKPLPGAFYSSVRHFQLDLREPLRLRYPVPPTPDEILADQQYQAYALYLAYYQEPGSLERLDKALALTKGPSKALDLLNEIFQWKIPGAERIYENYKDDARATSDVCGDPGLAVMDWARLFLGLPRSTKPRVHMDENGQLIPFETTPKGRAAAKGEDYSCRG